MENQPRSDKGKVRKVTLEDVLAAIRKVQPKVHGKTPTLALLYRLCIEAGLITRAQIAPLLFRRVVKQYELLKPDEDCTNKVRLAFAKAHANEMWQADTLYGPHVQINGSPAQTRLIAFFDDASRVCCHGQFFLAENVDTLIESLRGRFTNARRVPHSSTWTTVPFTLPRRSFKSAPASAASCITPRCGTARRKEKSNDFFAPCATSSWPASWPSGSAGLAQPPVHAMGPAGITTPRVHFHPRHESTRPLLPWIASGCASCRPTRPTTNCSLSRRNATSAPTTPSPSNRCALKRHGTCRIALSTSVSNARSPQCASSFITRASAWAKPACSTPSPTTANRSTHPQPEFNL